MNEIIGKEDPLSRLLCVPSSSNLMKQINISDEARTRDVTSIFFFSKVEAKFGHRTVLTLRIEAQLGGIFC